VWKKALKIKGTGAEGKNASRVAASQLFPEHAELFSRVKDDGVAEAALIAWYGATQQLGYRP
jgi:crossover junction endodeoxyribonuclease RuvC